MKFRKYNKLKWSGIFITLIAFLIIHFYAPRLITEIKNPVISIIRRQYVITNSPGFSINKKNGKYISFKSFDSTMLSAYYTYSKLDNSKGTIILLHGIRSKKEHFIRLSEKLSELGYNSVALDSRGHGWSEGQHCTFGVKEKLDVVALINFLERKEGIKNNIGVWGQSLGGAIGIQAMSIDKRIKFGIIESTFTDFEIITNDYFKYHLGFNIPILTDYLIYRAGVIADFNPKEAVPGEMAKNIEQPILIVHGNKDDRIDIKYGKALFSNIKSSRKEFIEINGATHVDVWKIGGENYFSKVHFFIKNSTKSKE